MASTHRNTVVGSWTFRKSVKLGASLTGWSHVVSSFLNTNQTAKFRTKREVAIICNNGGWIFAAKHNCLLEWICWTNLHKNGRSFQHFCFLNTSPALVPQHQVGPALWCGYHPARLWWCQAMRVAFSKSGPDKSLKNTTRRVRRYEDVFSQRSIIVM